MRISEIGSSDIISIGISDDVSDIINIITSITIMMSIIIIFGSDISIMGNSINDSDIISICMSDNNGSIIVC